MDWSDVDYLWIIVMFLSAVCFSFWRHPFTAEEWCNAQFLQICSDEETKSSTYLMIRGKLIYIFDFFGELPL